VMSHEPATLDTETRPLVGLTEQPVDVPAL
jgi:hypothetical protein